MKIQIMDRAKKKKFVAGQGIKQLRIGHRGVRRGACENTLTAFKLAKKQKFDGFEFDVQLSEDGEIFIFHDKNLKRFGDGGESVRDLNIDELKKINVGNFLGFGKEFIPTLDDVLDLWKKGEVPKYILLEVKGREFSSRNLEKILVDKLVEFDKDNPRLRLFDYLIIESFNIIVLRKIRKMLPDATMGLLIKGETKFKRLVGLLSCKVIDVDYVILEKKLIDKKYSDKFGGYRVGVYALESKEDYDKVKKLNLAILVADDIACVGG